MSGQTAEVAVTKTVVVEAPQEHAFRVFTERLDLWWPATHHIGAADLEQAVIEPRPGGRWFEQGIDGSECDWGEVLVWEPPSRVVLAWRITADWGYDPDLHTEVDVRFTAEADRRSRVELEHRGLEAYGDRAGEMRQTFSSPGGWNGMLEKFAEVAAA